MSAGTRNKQAQIKQRKGDFFAPPSIHSLQDPPLSIPKEMFNYYVRRFSGKRLRREEIPLSQEIFQALLKAQYFQIVPSLQKNLFQTKCQRCFNTDKHYFGIIHCARCHQKHEYCRHCLQLGRMLACEPLYQWVDQGQIWESQTNVCTWLGELSYIQNKAAQKIMHAIQKKQAILIHAVTGAGKTEMLFPGITNALANGMRICLASPRADVIRELLPRFKSAFQSLHIQGLYGGSKDNDGTAQLILATTHQLMRYDHAFDVMIIDEVDAFPYHQDPFLHRITSRAKKDEAATIYLTATPRATQKRWMARKEVDHIFVPIRYHLHPLILPKWCQDTSLKKSLLQNKLPHTLTSFFHQYSKESRQILLFVPTIAMAEKLFILLSQNISDLPFCDNSKMLTLAHAEDPHREIKIKRFRQKKIKLLITTTILERGVTFPSVDVYVLDAGHHVFDEAALIQIAGRAGRSPKDPLGAVIFIHDGKTNAMVQANKEINKMNQLRLKVLKEMEMFNA